MCSTDYPLNTQNPSRILLTTACKRVHARTCFMVRMIVYGELEPRAIMYNADLFILVHGPSSPELMTTMIRPFCFTVDHFPALVFQRACLFEVCNYILKITPFYQ